MVDQGVSQNLSEEGVPVFRQWPIRHFRYIKNSGWYWGLENTDERKNKHGHGHSISFVCDSAKPHWTKNNWKPPKWK